MRSQRPRFNIVSCLAIGVLLHCDGCDENKGKTAAKPNAATTSSQRPKASAAPTTTTPPAPTTMPEVTLDTAHVQLAMEDLSLTVPSFPAALKTLVDKYPVSRPDHVVLNIARNSKIADASLVVYTLFDAGAKKVEVHTNPRGTFPGKLVLTSDKAVGETVPPCTFAGTVRENFSVSFWPIKGATAKTYKKGMAGPDFTAMHEVFKKDVETCSSTVFYFSADSTVEWGHAFDLGTSLVAQNPPYKITNYVLLRESPVAGKPVKTTP